MAGMSPQVKAPPPSRPIHCKKEIVIITEKVCHIDAYEVSTYLFHNDKGLSVIITYCVILKSWYFIIRSHVRQNSCFAML